MPLDVVATAYGAPAAEALARVVAQAKGGDALAPVSVVVPSNYVGVSARRHLARGDGLIAVTFLTVYRFAELLASASLAAEGRRPVSNPVLLVAVQEELAASAGSFEAVRTHPATEEALLAAHQTLADLSPSALARLAGASPQARDVVDLHIRVRRRLAAWYDEADLLDAATLELERGHPVAAQLGHVAVYLPQDLSRRQAALLAAVAAGHPTTVVAGLTGQADADAGVLRSLAWLGAPASPAPPGHAPTAVLAREQGDASPELHVLTASDADEEVRAAVRVVAEAASAGTPLERIAVVHPGDPHYATLVQAHLEAAALPSNGAAPERLADRVAGRTLLDLLHLARRPPRRDEVFRLLAGAPFRRPSGGHLPSVAWERLSREAGLVGTSAEEWHVRLTALAEAKQDDAEAKQADDRDALARRLRREAEQCLALRDEVLGLLERLAAMQALRRWDALAEAARRLLHDLLGDERARAGWPIAEREAADRVEAAVDRLGHLDGVAPTVDLERFARSLALELDADLGRRGRFGHGVLVGRLGLVLGLDLDLVVVVGLAEGLLPTRERDDPLLPDRDRAKVADELPLAADRQRREHRQFLASVAAATRRVVLCFPRGDLHRTTEHVAVRWLLDLVEVSHGVRLWSDELAQHQAPWLAHVASFAGGLRTTTSPATEQDVRLANLVHGHLPLEDVSFERADRLLAARSRAAFSPYDGNVAGTSIRSPATAGQVVSPTRLESWSACPYGYFVRYLLGVEPVENPEVLLRLQALDAGTLVHEVLEGYVSARIATGAGLAAPDEGLLRRHFELACRRAEHRGVTGRPLLWRLQQEQLWRDLLAFVEDDARRVQEEQAQPLAAELSFGFDSEPIEVDLGDGRVLRLRGSADRVDRAGDGHLVVTDYKYGSPRKYATLSTQNPTANGSLLQLPAYGLAASAAFDADRLPLTVTARYAFAKPGRDGRRPAPREVQVDEPTVEGWRSALRVIVDGIEHGHFPARPGDDGARYAGYIVCPACDPDGLGTAEIARRWEQLHQAPELEAYLRLLGLAGGDDDGEESGDDG